ncbi:MAG TPA: hypothetical protein VHB79_09580 [Polyangiaceae bacterium]|nr:hypothetical protein [Polyangiaceae bacterium]
MRKRTGRKLGQRWLVVGAVLGGFVACQVTSEESPRTTLEAGAAGEAGQREGGAEAEGGSGGSTVLPAAGGRSHMGGGGAGGESGSVMEAAGGIPPCNVYPTITYLTCGDRYFPLSRDEEQALRDDHDAGCASVRQRLEAEADWHGGAGGSGGDGGASPIDRTFCDGFVERGTVSEVVGCGVETKHLGCCIDDSSEYKVGECSSFGQCCVIVEVE